MQADTDILRIILGGRFRLELSSGADVTPTSAKAQGLLALLASAPGHERTRLWLQEKLWSDRAREQAAASLRQELRNLRIGLGDNKKILIQNRMVISLDTEFCGIEDDLSPGQEFLEGIDIRDAAFNDWLTAERHHRHLVEATGGAARLANVPGTAAASGLIRPDPAYPGRVPAGLLRRAIVFETFAKPGDPLHVLETAFVSFTALGLSETMSVDVFQGRTPSTPPDAIQINVQSFLTGPDKTGMKVSAEDGARHQLIWSGIETVPNFGAVPVDHPDILRLSNQLIEALADALLLKTEGIPDYMDASLMGRMALRKIFSMQAEQLDEADKLLETAFELDPRGIFAAWRAQLRVIQHVERFDDDADRLIAEAEDHCYTALEVEPSNSMVLAAVAKSRLVLNDNVMACHELATKSVALNPSNPFAWDILSTAKLYAGDHEKAHALAFKAQQLGVRSPHSFWWDMGRCVTAALTGRAEEALRLAEVSHALSPHFRPPLRYLTALYAAQGQMEKAIYVARKLKQLEPDFSLERMAQDAKYPVSPLRKSGLLDKERLSDISGDENVT
ncbi:hypothetical protein [Litoreibacter roseus]|uniref:Uncharacterized protein n=1 Tax=Litoreibacter roseus TaxID=2601869 RepID=A0A6N6JBM1_9RHOB|nr:hypothetical protein [Litoreibacter roseus]GFE63671.1 hypothetical protein KIN_07450 [Litoreibacter roseus]